MKNRVDISNIVLWAYILIGMALFVPAVLFIPRQALFEIMDAVCVAIGAGTMVGYAPSFWHAMKLPAHKMTAAHLVVTCIFLMALASIIVFAGQWLWRVNGKPDWIIDSAPIAFSRWIVNTSLIVALLTSYSREGIVVMRAYRWTVGLVTVAVFIGALLIWIGLG